MRICQDSPAFLLVRSGLIMFRPAILRNYEFHGQRGAAAAPEHQASGMPCQSEPNLLGPAGGPWRAAAARREGMRVPSLALDRLLRSVVRQSATSGLLKNVPPGCPPRGHGTGRFWRGLSLVQFLVPSRLGTGEGAPNAVYNITGAETRRFHAQLPMRIAILSERLCMHASGHTASMGCQQEYILPSGRPTLPAPNVSIEPVTSSCKRPYDKSMWLCVACCGLEKVRCSVLPLASFLHGSTCRASSLETHRMSCRL